VVRERGSGVTPPIVVELLKNAVSEKSMLAVSKSTGLGLAAIGRYLKGVGEPTTATLQKLSDYFGVTVAQLRGEFESNDMDLIEKIFIEIADEMRADLLKKNPSLTKQDYSVWLDIKPGIIIKIRDRLNINRMARSDTQVVTSDASPNKND